MLQCIVYSFSLYNPGYTTTLRLRHMYAKSNYKHCTKSLYSTGYTQTLRQRHVYVKSNLNYCRKLAIFMYVQTLIMVYFVIA